MDPTLPSCLSCYGPLTLLAGPDSVLQVKSLAPEPDGLEQGEEGEEGEEGADSGTIGRATSDKPSQKADTFAALGSNARNDDEENSEDDGGSDDDGGGFGRTMTTGDVMRCVLPCACCAAVPVLPAAPCLCPAVPPATADATPIQEHCVEHSWPAADAAERRRLSADAGLVR